MPSEAIAVPSHATSTPRANAPTSWRLLAGARRGDTSALAALLDRYLPQVRRWAHRRLPRWARSSLDTSDLLHDAIVRTLGRLDAFQPRGRRALAAYLREAVRNRIRDEQRRLRSRGIARELDPDVEDRGDSPFDRAAAREAERRYRAALARLGPRDRELIVAHVELDYTHEQLGCMIGRSPNAARMALCRAIERLASLMREP